jgi:hypothetical protein
MDLEIFAKFLTALSANANSCGVPAEMGQILQ